MNPLCALLLMCLVCALTGCINENIQQYERTCEDCIFFDLQILNGSAILVHGSAPSPIKLSFGNSFSNAKPYFELLEPIHSHFAFRTLEAQTFRYIVHFPIFWTPSVPYAFLSSNEGIVESLFIFPQTANSANYEIHFNKPVLFSNNILSDSLILEKDALMQAYMIFYPRQIRCSKRFHNSTIQIMAPQSISWDDSYCDQLFSVVEYYTSRFGNPFGPFYTISVANARSFTSLQSGIFVERFNPSFISHELFHLFQPQGKCMENVIYKEGLATFMQHYSLKESGVISEQEFESILREYRIELSSLSDMQDLYFANNLTAFRIQNPYEHGLLVYAKGALVWQLIQEQYAPADEVFSKLLNGLDCEEINKITSVYERKLYGQLIANASRQTQ